MAYLPEAELKRLIDRPRLCLGFGTKSPASERTNLPSSGRSPALALLFTQSEKKGIPMCGVDVPAQWSIETGLPDAGR